tara:strand:+ start:5361 stop:5780 length:420 start_codon:yes stop_codon:yes gene_type:complete
MPIHNLRLELIDADLELKEKTDVTYEDLVDKVNIESEKKEDMHMEDMHMEDMWDDNLANEFMTQQFYYDENFTMKELYHIANYYEISKRKKKKAELIDDIIAFELDIENNEIVQTRKRLWFYLNEIKHDNYLSKFIILE